MLSSGEISMAVFGDGVNLAESCPPVSSVLRSPASCLPLPSAWPVGSPGFGVAVGQDGEVGLPQGANQPVSICSAPGLLSKCCSWGWTG